MPVCYAYFFFILDLYILMFLLLLYPFLQTTREIQNLRKESLLRLNFTNTGCVGQRERYSVLSVYPNPVPQQDFSNSIGHLVNFYSEGEEEKCLVANGRTITEPK